VGGDVAPRARVDVVAPDAAHVGRLLEHEEVVDPRAAHLVDEHFEDGHIANRD
jgi:hypothetical protein